MEGNDRGESADESAEWSGDETDESETEELETEEEDETAGGRGEVS